MLRADRDAGHTPPCFLNSLKAPTKVELVYIVPSGEAHGGYLSNQNKFEKGTRPSPEKWVLCCC